MTKKLYIGSLPYAVTDADLEKIFSDVGQGADKEAVFREIAHDHFREHSLVGREIAHRDLPLEMAHEIGS